MSDFMTVAEVRRSAPRVRGGWSGSEWIPVYDVVDVSGPGSFGYRFELRQGGRVIAQSVDTWEPDTINKGGQKGAFRVGFRRSDLPWEV